MKTLKAGCFLINTETKQIGLTYRKIYDDYSFPKGHLDTGETLSECALRETEEEVGRKAKLLRQDPIYIMTYKTPKNEECECHYYLAKDIGETSKTFPPELVEELKFIPFNEVENILTYKNLKEMWNVCKPIILEYLQ